LQLARPPDVEFRRIPEVPMRRATLSCFLLLSLTGSALSQPSLPRLFQKAKEQFRLGSYDVALATLSDVERESEKPENQAYRSSLRPGLAFYQGACLAALGRDQEAREQFGVFLAFSPNASLDPGAFPKKVIALLEEARREARRPRDETQEDSSISAAYRAYVRSDDRHPRELSEDWADGPVRYLLSADERRAFSQLSDPVSRSEFVTNFWRARDPKPETTENEFREEFEKRVAFADTHFTEGELRGSLTDRGMVFVLLGAPTYVGRRPIKTGEDTGDPSGMARYSRNDVTLVEKTMGSGTAATNVVIDNMTGPSNLMPDALARWREVWHYRREVLPRDTPYQQVDFDFITSKGYGKNVLQREAAALNTLEAARRAIIVDRSRRASR
jgi:GWxTD domain-containing protein